MRRWQRRAIAVVFVVGAMAVGYLITDNVSLTQADPRPYVESGDVGDTVSMPYADVEVTDVRPAQYLGSDISSELAVMASGVWVVVSATATATREPVRLRSGWLEGADGLRYRASSRSRCATAVPTSTGVPLHSVWCFDVPTDALSGLHFRLARGDLRDPGDEEIDGDSIVDVDLDISPTDAREWAGTTDAYRAATYAYDPIELVEITLNEVDS